MKTLNNFINESKEVTFIRHDDPRTSTVWKEGDKVLMIKYDEYHYSAKSWGIYTIKKVNAKSIIIDYPESEISKFDSNGILKMFNKKTKYWKAYDSYWVLYNAELVEKSKDIKELDEKGSCIWGFHFMPNDDIINRFKKDLKEFKNIK